MDLVNDYTCECDIWGQDYSYTTGYIIFTMEFRFVHDELTCHWLCWSVTLPA